MKGLAKYECLPCGGSAFGVIQAASRSPSGGSIRPRCTPLNLVLIASVYIGLAVADGRWVVFVLVAAAAVTESPWLLVVGLAGHGLKDLWQHRSQFVANTRWWPPFCLVVDWVAAAIIAVEIVAGVQFHN